jgi:hypothetical protein
MDVTAGPRIDRRKEPRMHMGLPVKVQGHDPDGRPWEEMTMSEDAYWGGVGFLLRHSVVKGNALYLSLPLPKQFRSYDLTSASYNVWGLVRHTGARSDGATRVGVMFLGKNPPRGHAEHPGSRFLLAVDAAADKAAKERRRVRRFDLEVNVTLRTTNGDEKREYTVTRNVGIGGAQVLTTLTLARNDLVLLEEVGGIFRARAEVKHIHIGKDNIPRLNLAFIDEEAPREVRDLLKRNGLFE